MFDSVAVIVCGVFLAKLWVSSDETIVMGL